MKMESALGWVVFLLGLIHHVDGRYNHAAYNLCLSCHNVRDPRECTNFAEIWPTEMCTTERVMILNGTIVWNFGFKDSGLCTGDEAISTSGSILGTRRRANQHSGSVLCNECCHTSLCNHKLCGSQTNNYVLCLSGEETRYLPPISQAAYCSQNQSCYAIMQANSRPEHFHVHYGCVSKAVCRELNNTDYHRHCQRCCESDGCNANLCQVQHIDADTNTNRPAPQASTTGLHSSAVNPTSGAASTDNRSSTGSPNSAVRTTSTQIPLFTDCWDLQSRGFITESGVYEIHPVHGSNASLNVRCDMVTDGGGWTVLQRRFDGSVNFTRSMTEYVEGFGDVAGEHWVGLEAMHHLTLQGAIQMRVDLCAFNGQTGYAVYSGFIVSGQNDTYRLHTGVYANGNIEDSLRWHNGRVFQATGMCADSLGGGWWYGGCIWVNLNGGRYNGGDYQGIVWVNFGGGYMPSLRSVEMKIRPITTPGDRANPYTCPP